MALVTAEIISLTEEIAELEDSAQDFRTDVGTQRRIIVADAKPPRGEGVRQALAGGGNLIEGCGAAGIVISRAMQLETSTIITPYEPQAHI